ncbi:MAG: hypothetical protein DI562_01945 [Stenotrophomonas acidaminiphila]|nr:MAG: hypothetical protein DI562_01945 [Stenotrophomonas acidaminiphila]
MSMLYLLLALVSAAAFYLGSPHQRLWVGAGPRRRWLRVAGWASAALALMAGVAALGVWAGVFSALTAWMFGTVALPYADVWWHTRRENRHVG